jgi:hypothetical protein
MSERKSAYRVMVRKPEGRRPLERPRHRREDNIKMDKEAGWGNGLIQSGLELGQVAGSSECGNEPSRSIIFRESLD